MEDYDAWAHEESFDGSPYTDVLPYFRRSEGSGSLGGPHHGTERPLGITSTTPHPLARVFVRAA